MVVWVVSWTKHFVQETPFLFGRMIDTNYGLDNYNRFSQKWMKYSGNMHLKVISI